jgi:hypothetical protein
LLFQCRVSSSFSATVLTRFCSTTAAQRLRNLGGEALEVDIEPLLEAARLLYEGPWVAERYLATEALLTTRPEACWR